MAAARGKSSQNHHFLWVSEVTLGIFGVQFWGFSVLHCHGVFPSGDQLRQQQKRLQQPEEKPAKIHSSSKKKKQPKSSFSMGFRSYVRHFRDAILGLLRPSLPWSFLIRGPAAAAAKAFIFIAAARRKRSQNHHFLWVSEVTLGIFGMQFWGFSVLHCHGVFPSGDQQQQQKRLQQQDEKVAKIHGSSKKKKQPKSSFSMGFRSYVRHFRGAILELLRASLPCCFPIRGPAAAAKASAAAGGKGSQNSWQQQEEKVAKIIIFYGFQKLRKAFSGCNSGASPSFTAVVIHIRGAAAAAKASAAAGGTGSQNS